ncbi:hypothetical protein [Myxacorys almedinensis]|nr:hypothetical protein [Myxacorys almedinensis]
MHDRDAILASVTAEIDRTLAQINTLLGHTSPYVESSELAAEPDESERSPAFSRSNQPQQEPAEANAPRRKGRPKSAAKLSAAALDSASDNTLLSAPKSQARKSKAFEPQALDRKFKNLTPQAAIVQVMTQNPEQAFTTDEMIEVLYGNFEGEALAKARKSVAGFLSRGVIQKRLAKVQINPSRFKLVSSEETGIESPDA